MAISRRPLADRLELEAPRAAALAARAVARLPGSIRRRVLRTAFDRARDAYNRGDMEVVFALFAPDVEYGPPPPLHSGAALHGRTAVLDFWREVLTRFDENTIENLALEEASPGRIVRRARLHHRSSLTGEELGYEIVQSTELQGGRVIRQVNALAPNARSD